MGEKHFVLTKWVWLFYLFDAQLSTHKHLSIATKPRGKKELPFVSVGIYGFEHAVSFCIRLVLPYASASGQPGPHLAHAEKSATDDSWLALSS